MTTQWRKASTPSGRFLTGQTVPAAARPHSAGYFVVQLAAAFCDRVAPASLFAMAAIIRLHGFLTSNHDGLGDPSLLARLVTMLDLTNHVLSFLFLSLVAILFLVRRTRRGSRAGPRAMAIALGGTFIMNFALIQPVTSRDWSVLALADVALVGGLAFTIYAALSLRRCFGLAPEARGLVTTGAYRLVRHPLYLGEFAAFFGALLPVLAPLTAVIFVLFCALQATRARLEEQVLVAAFAEYAAYRRRTPALLPWPRPS
jgi:protein-S-isoprenylcysteine O-methyltransferase Ste14